MLKERYNRYIYILYFSIVEKHTEDVLYCFTNPNKCAGATTLQRL